MISPKTLCLLLGCLLTGLGQAQIQLISSSTRSLHTDLNLAQNAIGPVLPGKMTPGQALIETLGLTLEEAELIVDYRLKPIGEEEYYQVDISFFLNGERLAVRNEHLLGDVGEQQASAGNVNKQIIWTDIPESHLNLEGDLNLTLTVELWGKPELPYNVDCSAPPSFTARQQMPYYFAAVAGVAAIGTGWLIKNNGEDIYNNDYLTAPTEDVAEPFFQDANDKRHTGLILQYSGAAVLLIDAVWYGIRYFRFKKRHEVFQEYCNPGRLSLSPKVQYSPVNGTARVGMKMRYAF